MNSNNLRVQLNARIAGTGASSRWLIAAVLALWGAGTGLTQSNAPKTEQAVVESDGTVKLPAMTVPYSSLASKEAKKNFLDFTKGFASLIAAGQPGDDINTSRKRLDDILMRPGVEKLRAVFPVTIKPEIIGGVQTDIIEPVNGIAERNRHRVLINLHGGGFGKGARYGGQMESIPIASLGAIRVITVDYRLGPENRFPAASEDVAAVYRELLKVYRPENIGIYGCSAGGMLTAEAVAWFQAHDLPRPGAIGIFGAGAMVPMRGDSYYFATPLLGWWLPSASPPDATKIVGYFNVPGLDQDDPLVSPVFSPTVLAKFPPTLLISGTRDPGLSPAVFTHSKLVKLGVAAHLHVWEGAAHGSYAQPVVDPDVPETREAWDVTVKFFELYLGR